MKKKGERLVDLEVKFLLFCRFVEGNGYVWVMGKVRVGLGKGMFEGRER